MERQGVKNSTKYELHKLRMVLPLIYINVGAIYRKDYNIKEGKNKKYKTRRYNT